MDERLIVAGPEDGLSFRLLWEQSTLTGSACAATRGWLRVSIAGQPIWGERPEGIEPGFSWTWIELLEHLATAWPFLLWEEVDPLGLLRDEPDALREAAEARWSQASSAVRDAEERELFEYITTHDLAHAVEGALVAPLWLRREGNNVLVSSRGTQVRRPLTEVVGTLETLGNAIRDRLDPLEAGAGRAIKTWNARAAVDQDRLVSIATGIGSDALAELLPECFEWNAGLDQTEYLAAARMSAKALSATQLRDVLNEIRRVPQVWTGPIDAMASEAAKELQGSDEPNAHDQGYQIAGWLRHRRALPPDSRIDPAAILAEWGIPVYEFSLACRQLDAVSVWGPHHGPAILTNRKGLHGRGNGRRATLAHEIAHLLLDRSDALPVAEVLGGSVPPFVEARARAFAAELLAPRSVVAPTLAAAADPLGEVRSLSVRFGASVEIIAWQAINGRVRLSDATRAFLRTCVSEPARV